MAYRFRGAAAGSAFVALGLAGVLSACSYFGAAGRSGNAAVPQPVKTVELPRYLGLWYELGRYENGFERDCEGVTAEYGTRPDGLISVTNTCREGGPGGRVRVARGRARVVPANGNAKLKVSFFGPFFLGNYWILDHADDYSWAIVGEPSGRFLWVLSREPVPEDAVYSGLVRRASELGYDMGLFRRTIQPPN